MEGLANYERAPHTGFVYASDVEEDSDSLQIYVANLITSETLVLDHSGAVIWELLELSQSEVSLVQEVADFFQQPVEVVQAATLDFVESMVSNGLIRKY